jgi:hypothetical protein
VPHCHLPACSFCELPEIAVLIKPNAKSVPAKIWEMATAPAQGGKPAGPLHGVPLRPSPGQKWPKVNLEAGKAVDRAGKAARNGHNTHGPRTQPLPSIVRAFNSGPWESHKASVDCRKIKPVDHLNSIAALASILCHPATNTTPKAHCTKPFRGKQFDLGNPRPCSYCHFQPPSGEWCGVDQLVGSRGYLLNNSLSACWDCNRSKNDSTIPVFKEQADNLASNLTALDKFAQEVRAASAT